MVTTRSGRAIIFGLIAVAFLGIAARDVTAQSQPHPEHLLSLQYEGAAPASPDDDRQLYNLAIAITESSNFNSRAPLWNWDLAEILSDYRRAVDGRYLLVSFASPLSVKTVGGDVMVKEILIGLNGSQYASSLHTVDDEGRVVGHAKYSGELCIQLYQLVTKMDRHLTRRSSGP